jgi:hypothetical protein
MAADHKRQAQRIFGMGFRSANHFGVQKISAILSWNNSTDITKDMRKVLLSFEATHAGMVR